MAAAAAMAVKMNDYPAAAAAPPFSPLQERPLTLGDKLKNLCGMGKL